jgi:hypothetical protein
MKKLKLFALTAVALMGASGVANAELSYQPGDPWQKMEAFQRKECVMQTVQCCLRFANQ